MYVKVTNGVAQDYTIGKLRRDNPSVCFPKQVPNETLAAFDVYPAVREDEPSYNPRTEKVDLLEPAVQVNGVWTYQWSKTDKTDDEIATYDSEMSSINRAKRDSLLYETDWTACSDVTMSAEMTTYRQALRDITDHANFPYLEDADWPTKP